MSVRGHSPSPVETALRWGFQTFTIVNKNQIFQEEIHLKLTCLAVITLLVLGFSSSAAFAQSGSFALGFLSYTGGTQYCDYEEINYSDPYAAGIHDGVDVCGFSANGAQVGFKGTIPKTAGPPVPGTDFQLADSSFDAFAEGFTGCQIDWVTLTKASKVNLNKPKYGWAFYYTCGGGIDYLGNYGFLTTQLGARDHNGVAKSTLGKAQEQIKSKTGTKLN